MKRGSRKYRCEDCACEQTISRQERDRAARPRCCGCGSPRIEPVTAEAKRDIIFGNRNLVEGEKSGVVLSSWQPVAKVV